MDFDIWLEFTALDGTKQIIAKPNHGSQEWRVIPADLLPETQDAQTQSDADAAEQAVFSK